MYTSFYNEKICLYWSYNDVVLAKAIHIYLERLNVLENLNNSHVTYDH